MNGPVGDTIFQNLYEETNRMTDLLNMLHDERASLLRKLTGVDAAIAALNGHSAAPVKAVKKRTMSAAGRAKIAAAQRKRWAKIKR